MRPLALIDASELNRFPPFPALSTLTRVVMPVFRSRTKMSSTPLVSPGTRLEANVPNATKRPLALIDGRPLSAFPSFPALSTLTRVVVPVFRS
jgi:hypothetical protein